MLEQMDGSYNNPYKFNAKELDEDTGLYYYGARYYNPRLSIWYGIDPLAVYNPIMESEFYGDGEHNGGVFYWANLNPYIYTYQNPIIYTDPNGKQTLSPALGYGSGGGKMEDLTKAGETITRFFKGAGNYVKDVASSLLQSAKMAKSTITFDKDGYIDGLNEMSAQGKEFNRYITSGDVLDDLQTPEGLGYASAMITTIVLSEKVVMGRKVTMKQVLDNPKILENMHPSDFLKSVKSDKNWKIGTLDKGSNKGGGFKASEVMPNGKLSGRQIRYNPGSKSGRKGGDPYWWVINYNGKSNPIKVKK